MGEESFSSLVHKVDIDTAWLQGLQDYYCNIAKLFVFIVDEDGNMLTEMSGNPNEIGRISAVISNSQVSQMIDRVMHSNAEEQIVEKTEYSNIRIATIAIKTDGAAPMCWVVLGVIDSEEDESAILNISSKIHESDFLKALDFLRIISKKIYQTTYSRVNAVAESVRSKSAELEMLHELRKSEFMTDIVSLLDSDESFEEICDQMVRYVGGFSDIAYAYVIRPNVNGSNVDVMGEYDKKGVVPLLKIIKSEDVLRHLKGIGDKPMVISESVV